MKIFFIKITPVLQLLDIFMGKFLTGDDLENAIRDIILDAKKELLIVSPYVKLGEYFRDLFLTHLKNPSLHIILIFGKNEKEITKSLSAADLDFFKQFPNISIVYVKNLHAKYYGNENKGMVTSINLYDYSFKNNIEFGVYRQTSFKDYLSDSFDTEIYNFCIDMTTKFPAIFIKRPIFEKKLMGLSTTYLGSDVPLDQSKCIDNSLFDESKRISDYEDHILKDGSKGIVKLTRKEFESQNQLAEVKVKEQNTIKLENRSQYAQNPPDKAFHGYCIRTGVEISFNPERPFCLEAFRTWNYWGDENFPENFCHFSGEPSGGNTSKAKPVLYKYWKNVKALS